LVSFNICMYLWNDHHNQENEQITPKRFLMPLCSPFLLVHPYPFPSLPHTTMDLLSVTID
jgi:hypothetical protein